jgi:D-serine deaminase-like pyridoxal phosphate-dependent protein
VRASRALRDACAVFSVFADRALGVGRRRVRRCSPMAARSAGPSNVTTTRPTSVLPRTPWRAADYALDERDLARLPSPALVVFLEHMRRNIDALLARMGGRPERWRPHLKTTKSPRLWSELLDRGVRAFKCATVGEAAALLELGRARGLHLDLLVAYPHHGPAAQRLVELAERHAEAKVAVLVESVEDAARWPAPLALFVDVNPGMDRTGLSGAAHAEVLALARAAGERLRGLHWYDGHRLERDLAARRRAAHDGYRDLVALALELARRGVRVDEIVTSGTPAFGAALDFHPFETLHEHWPAAVHRVSPGTVVLHDARSEELDPTLGLVPAALVLARVVSRPRHGRVTCDAGSKALGADAGAPIALVLDWPRLLAAAPSEEHLPLDAQAAPDELPARGAPLWLVPRHVCTTVNLYDEAVLVEGGRIVGCAPISARGHALWGLA